MSNIDTHLQELTAYRDRLGKQLGITDPSKLPKLPSKAELVERMLETYASVFHGEKFSKLQSYVLTVHYLAENLINYAIAAEYFPKASDSETRRLSDDVIFELPFAKKVDIIRKRQIYSRAIVKTLYRINDVRVAVAHSVKLNDSKYIYRGKPIFVDGFLELLWNDLEDIMAEHSNAMRRIRPKVKV